MRNSDVVMTTTMLMRTNHLDLMDEVDELNDLEQQPRLPQEPCPDLQSRGDCSRSQPAKREMARGLKCSQWIILIMMAIGSWKELWKRNS